MSEQDFLGRIVEARRQAVARDAEARPLAQVRRRAHVARRDAAPRALREKLSRGGTINVIAEIKRASPSKGELRGEIDPAALARAYERGGAAAISVLTEEEFFRGSLEDLRKVRGAVSLPVLRKDFIVDEWQVYEAAEAGSDALLLIVAALDDATLARLLRLTEGELGMDALVEVHDAGELRRAQSCGAQLVGVNNRNLRTFEVSLETSVELARLATPGVLLVSESGLGARADLERLAALGFRGFLIGETLMRSDDPETLLRELTGA
ncbi:MAG TPA: indole-3-glycerol phosphate synthase TrpC [Pyrinomonadaceae bacterium]|jgi:indole-3-glycerol phosphate synthase|nr:indole-3-glycerol phosphate synthase TrpC [Pyrinomonadaceae bacterium]